MYVPRLEVDWSGGLELLHPVGGGGVLLPPFSAGGVRPKGRGSAHHWPTATGYARAHCRHLSAEAGDLSAARRKGGLGCDGGGVDGEGGGEAGLVYAWYTASPKIHRS